MKKVLLFVLAAFFACYTVNAQILFSDGFESGLTAWTLSDEDGDGYNWAYYTGADGYSNSGSCMAYSASYDNSVGVLTPDNWMITAEPITIPATGFNLTWYVAAGDGNYPAEKYSVYVATVNTVSGLSATTPVHTETLSTDEWEMKTVSMDAYAGQSVYIAFRHYDVTDQYEMLLDDVKISKVINTPEINLASLVLPSAVSMGESFNVSGVVLNSSTVALTSYDVTYSVNGGANVATYSVTGVNIASGETSTFVHNVPAVINTPGDATITVTVSNPNGTTDYEADNTKTGSVLVCGTITAPHTQDFENGLGCWSKYVATESTYDLIGTGSPYANNIDPYEGDDFFVFLGYQQTDLDQYLISPELDITENVALKFYHASFQGGESIQVMTSTTDNQISSFTALGDAIEVGEDYAEASFEIPASTKYIAIKYVSGSMTVVDYITITEISTVPEIVLTSLDIPSMVSTGEQFNVSGVVTNNSGAALTSFKVQYTINGTASAVYTVTGQNVAYGETCNFTHNVPASIAEAGNYTVSVTVSEPNGTADNTADNTLTASVLVCGTVSVPHTQDFENGLGCWSKYVATESTYELIGTGSPYAGNMDAHGGDDFFVFLGYNQTDLDQYLISPELDITENVALKFFHASFQGGETLQVMTSTTDNQISSFTTLGDAIEVGEDYAEASFEIPASTKYIAIKYVSGSMMTAVDDVTITEMPTTPEIALTSVNVPSMVSTGEQFNVSGVVTNNSGAALTSFKVQYTVNGTTSEVYTVTGQNVAFGATCNFTHNVPASIAEAGNYTVSVTVSEPNGTADNTADNTLTASIAVCGVVSTLPYTEGFEGGLGCWSAISNNTENADVENRGLGVVDGASTFSNGGAHGGNSCFVFSSYNDATDYTQYLISPEFNLPSACTMKFFYTQRSNTYPESCVVMVSTTTNDPASFSQIGETVSADQMAGTWTEATFEIPANTKYIAFKYTVEDAMWFMGIDDISLEAGTTPGPGPDPDPDPSGIDDVTANSVKLYPNPTTGNLYVDVEGLQKVEIIDAVGRVVMSQNNGTVNMSNLANGIYTVRVSANGTTTIKKVVKK